MWVMGESHLSLITTPFSYRTRAGRRRSNNALQRDEIMRQVSTALESPRKELLSFRLGDQEFCVDIMAVREIRGWTEATPLPRAPDYIRALINLRGTVFPVVDMSVRLGLPANDLANRKGLLVVLIDTKLVG